MLPMAGVCLGNAHTNFSEKDISGAHGGDYEDDVSSGM
jgi:hypothetical protein